MAEPSRCLDSHPKFLGNFEPSNFGLKAQNIWHTFFEEGILKNSSVQFGQSSATVFVCVSCISSFTVDSHRKETFLAKCAGCLSVCCMKEPCLCMQQAPGSQEVMLSFSFKSFFLFHFFPFLAPTFLSPYIEIHAPFWPIIAAIILEPPAPI